MTDIEALKSVIKERGLGFANDPKFVLRRIKWGIPRLDNFIGGGLPRERFNVLAGQPGAGKTFLLLCFIAKCIEDGLSVAYYDCEQAVDSVWATKAGVDLSKLIFSQQQIGEDMLDEWNDLMDAGLDVLVIDSIPSVITKGEFENDADWNPQALRARFWSMAMPRMIAHLKNGTCVIFINQLRSSTGGGMGDTTVLPGGQAAGFFASVVLMIRRAGWIQKGKETVGHTIRIRHRKNKVGGDEYGVIDIPFLKVGKIDMGEMNLLDATSKEPDAIILQAGSSYTWQSEVDDKGVPLKWRGWDNVVAYFDANPDQAAKLEAEVASRGSAARIDGSE